MDSSLILIGLLLKLQILNVFLLVDLKKMVPISMMTGPTEMFFSSSEESYLAITLSSCWFFATDGKISIVWLGFRWFKSIFTYLPFLFRRIFVLFKFSWLTPFSPFISPWGRRLVSKWIILFEWSPESDCWFLPLKIEEIYSSKPDFYKF